MPTAPLQGDKTPSTSTSILDSNIKPSDGEALVMELWWVGYLFIAITSRSTLTQNGNTC